MTITLDPGNQLSCARRQHGDLHAPVAASLDHHADAKSDGIVEGQHFGYVTQRITSTGDIWSGLVLGTTGKNNEIVVDRSLFPAGATATNALRGYLVRIYDGTGEGQYRRIFESYLNDAGQLVLATETRWDTMPDIDAHWVVSGYDAPATTGALGGKVEWVSADRKTIRLTGVTLPTANGGLAGAIVRIVDGSGPGQYRRIAWNDEDEIRFVDAWGADTAILGATVAILGLHGVDVDRLSVAIADSDTPGVVVRPSDGSTRVIEGDATTRVTDTYTVRLTQKPGQTLKVYLTPQQTPTAYFDDATQSFVTANRVQVTLSGPRVQTEVVDGVTRYFVLFDDTNWDDEVTVTVTAIQDGVRDGNDLQSFAPIARRAGAVQGPLFVFGGLDPDPAYNTSLDGYQPIVLPDETSGPPKPPVLPTIRVDETKQVDRLIVHNEDSPADDIGKLTATRITGLGMAPDTYVAGRLFQGGITYGDLEALEILLGYGNDTFVVDSTHAGTTLIDAGRGEDVIGVFTVSGHTMLFGREDDDTVVVGTEDVGTEDVDDRTLDEIKALLSIDGGSGYDMVFLDDSAELDANWASITPTSVTGLDMTAGSDRVWTLRPGTAQVVTVVVAGVGFLKFSVGAPTEAQEALGIRELTAANLQAALQQLIFPLGMSYQDDGEPGVTEDDWAFTGCGELETSDCAPSVWVQQIGDGFLIGFHGELQGSAAPSLQAFDTGAGVATIASRRDGVEYVGLEVLDLTTGSGADVVNVRGTGATSHTDLHLGDGNDRIYVSSLANVPLSGGGSRPDYLFGDLSLIGGTLNIDAGTGRHTLLISDEASLDGDEDVVITGNRTKAIAEDGRTHLHRRRLTSDEELRRRRHLRRGPGRPRDHLHRRPDRHVRRRHPDLGRPRRRHHRDRRHPRPAEPGRAHGDVPQHRAGRRRGHRRPEGRRGRPAGVEHPGRLRPERAHRVAVRRRRPATRRRGDGRAHRWRRRRPGPILGQRRPGRGRALRQRRVDRLRLGPGRGHGAAPIRRGPRALRGHQPGARHGSPRR